MKKLARYFKGYWTLVVLAPTFKLIEAVFELITPLLVAVIVDDAIPAGDTHTVWVQCAYMVLLGGLGLALSLGCQYMASRAGSGFAAAVRRAMLVRVNTLSYRDLDRMTPSSLANRMTNDVNQAQQGASMAMRLLTRSPFLVVGATVGAVIISPKIALIFLAAAILIAVSLYFIMSRTAPMYARAAKQTDGVAAAAKENLSGARVIRAYAKESDELEKSEAAVDALCRTNLRINRISALLNPLATVIVNLGIVAVIAWGGRLAETTGALTVGQIIMLVNYLTQIQLSLVVLANLIVMFTRSGAAVRRINEVLNLVNTLPDPADGESLPDTAAPAMEFKNVSFGYHAENGNCIEAIDWTIPAGARVGIIGGTGSGKTTLVNLLTRRYDVTDGEIRVFGHNVKDYTADALLSIFGVVPQSAALLAGTIRENLRWRDQTATDAELWHALELAQAKEFVARYADGLDHEVTHNGHNFSGGQRQRLTIARALVGNPHILILDDSASALDAATDYRLRTALRSLSVTTVTISQRAGSLMDCDAILVLDGGEAAGLGTHTALMQTCEIYREIYSGQIAKGGAV